MSTTPQPPESAGPPPAWWRRRTVALAGAGGAPWPSEWAWSWRWALTTTGRRAPDGGTSSTTGTGPAATGPDATAGGPGRPATVRPPRLPGATGGTGGTGTGATAPVARPGTAAAPGPIAFASRRFGAPGIFVVAGDGTGEKRLTPAQGEYFTPVWSPDGTRIAFAGRRVDNTDVYVVNADGSGERRLTTDAGNDFDPAWSPDGRRIAFTPSGARRRAVSPGSTGTPPTSTSSTPTGAGSADWPTPADDEFGPAWSPDGTPGRLHPRHRRRGGHLGGRRPTGADARAIVNPPGQNVSPVWSPDGTRLAFVSNRAGNSDVFVAGADGSGARAVTGDPGEDLSPAWSPDGRRLAYISQRSADRDVHVVDADGRNDRALAANRSEEATPAWSPDGGPGRLRVGPRRHPPPLLRGRRRLRPPPPDPRPGPRLRPPLEAGGGLVPARRERRVESLHPAFVGPGRLPTRTTARTCGSRRSGGRSRTGRRRGGRGHPGRRRCGPGRRGSRRSGRGCRLTTRPGSTAAVGAGRWAAALARTAGRWTEARVVAVAEPVGAGSGGDDRRRPPAAAVVPAEALTLRPPASRPDRSSPEMSRPGTMALTRASTPAADRPRPVPSAAVAQLICSGWAASTWPDQRSRAEAANPAPAGPSVRAGRETARFSRSRLAGRHGDAVAGGEGGRRRRRPAPSATLAASTQAWLTRPSGLADHVDGSPRSGPWRREMGVGLRPIGGTGRGGAEDTEGQQGASADGGDPSGASSHESSSRSRGSALTRCPSPFPAA